MSTEVPPPATAEAKTRRGNPNLALAPRCGARTRAGCPCRAPAIRGKLRCRMHGGRSTGPRTEEGLTRLRIARTIHGHYGAEVRARDRHLISLRRNWQITKDAIVYLGRIPSDLLPPYLSPGLSRAEERAALQAEAEAHAPWKRAIAEAKAARRRASPARSDVPLPEPHAPATRPAATAATHQPAARPHAPVSHLRERLLESTSLTPPAAACRVPPSASPTIPATAPPQAPMPPPRPAAPPRDATSATPAQTPASPAPRSP